MAETISKIADMSILAVFGPYTHSGIISISAYCTGGS